jgi:hypothetical protein
MTEFLLWCALIINNENKINNNECRHHYLLTLGLCNFMGQTSPINQQFVCDFEHYDPKTCMCACVWILKAWSEKSIHGSFTFELYESMKYMFRIYVFLQFASLLLNLVHHCHLHPGLLNNPSLDNIQNCQSWLEPSS